jgi:DNA-binding protein Fis
MRVDGGGNGGNEFQERDLLYKVLFDMKNDLNDLKSLIYELVKSNNLRMPEMPNLRTLPAGGGFTATRSDAPMYVETDDYAIGQSPVFNTQDSTPRIIIDPNRTSTPSNTVTYDKSEVEDAPLAMDEIEKDAIKRALKKYNGRRKEAAEELRISERTLYRKIRQYDL